ncbi:MAG: UDP-N-acetylglucosamine 1-carboxyvinyltransferase [Chloroflexota bacterium]|jgi:UDP-N-acetylglucosamine 1-carboxyvinyltransferase
MTLTGQPLDGLVSGQQGSAGKGERFTIDGGLPLSGAVQVDGAKNAALPIMAACLLTPEPCTIHNIPNIEDIRSMAQLLESIGAKVAIHNDRSITITASEITNCAPPAALMQRMRASFLTVGPLLARAGQATAPHPGGCAIGVRPVNVDIRGFLAMGARILQSNGVYAATAENGLRGASIYLDYPSHTGTENLLMAAVLAKGKTIIKHASVEPEVVDLANFLVAMGAKIDGIGSTRLEIEGVQQLHGCEYSIIPDRLIAGTYAIAAAITQGDVRIEQIVPEHLDPVTYKLMETGVLIEEGEDWLRIVGRRPLNAVEVQAIHYPGFPTDLQAAFTTLLTQAVGTSIIHERVFENRLLYVSELEKLGADIKVVNGQTAHVVGPVHLTGTKVKALDIRSGAAMILAALAAEGTTEVEDVRHVNRGYADIVGDLLRLGASIRREE